MHHFYQSEAGERFKIGDRRFGLKGILQGTVKASTTIYIETKKSIFNSRQLLAWCQCSLVYTKNGKVKTIEALLIFYYNSKHYKTLQTQ